ncbi:Mpp10 protein, partial [Opisthorchis viverrini]
MVAKVKKQLEMETERLEQRMLDDKPWYLKGEVVAQDRAENTVLEEYLDVQRHGKFKPPPADEDKILEFIKKAIKEQSFDSPVFKCKEKPSQSTGQAVPITAQQKSLVEDYENLFAKKNLLEKEQEDPVKNSIQAEMRELFEKLDSLSHLHFVPYKHSPEATVLQSKQAMVMEEAGPAATSTADLLAPEEVFAPRGEVLKGATELTSTDRRRHRKKLMRIRSTRRKLKTADPTKNKEAALQKIIRLAHKPGSNIKIV